MYNYISAYMFIHIAEQILIYVFILYIFSEGANDTLIFLLLMNGQPWLIANPYING